MSSVPVLTTPAVDIRHAALMATLAGSLLWALASGYAIVGAPTGMPPSGVIIRCVVERVVALGVAGIFGVYVTTGVCVFGCVTDVSLVGIIGVALGSVSWVITPKVIELLEKALLRKAEKVIDK